MNLGNQFLIAMPGLADPNFAGTLTLVCEHNEQGALGFIVNRPTEIRAADVFSQYTELTEGNPFVQSAVLYAGGPVDPERGFVLHSAERQWDATLRVSDSISVTASNDILTAIARGEGPERFLILLGYAGWGPGQLEEEISANAWLTTEADPAIVFDLPPEQRWHAAARALGIELNLINPQAGHA